MLPHHDDPAGTPTRFATAVGVLPPVRGNLLAPRGSRRGTREPHSAEEDGLAGATTS